MTPPVTCECPYCGASVPANAAECWLCYRPLVIVMDGGDETRPQVQPESRPECKPAPSPVPGPGPGAGPRTRPGSSPDNLLPLLAGMAGVVLVVVLIGTFLADPNAGFTLLFLLVGGRLLIALCDQMFPTSPPPRRQVAGGGSAVPSRRPSPAPAPRTTSGTPPATATDRVLQGIGVLIMAGTVGMMFLFAVVLALAFSCRVRL